MNNCLRKGDVLITEVCPLQVVKLSYLPGSLLLIFQTRERFQTLITRSGAVDEDRRVELGILEYIVQHLLQI